jgi:PEP-CTERM motif-containing protein
MFGCTESTRVSALARMAVVVLTLAVSAQLAAPALAATGTGNPDFSIKITEKEGNLGTPDAAMMHYLMWDLGVDRVADRNMPVLEVKNMSDSPLKELTMTIGDDRFNFNCAILKACAAPVKSSPVTDFTSSTTDGNEILINFGDGLAKNEVARFRIALAVDADHKDDFYKHPDYRTVLFDMNGINVYDGNLHNAEGDDGKGDNSTFTALYGSGESAKTSETTFPDFEVDGTPGQYYNNIYRRYGIMERVDTFQGVGNASAGIPEPSTFCLAGLGLIGLVVLKLRSRK